MRLSALLPVLLLVAPQAQAGAWTQEAGQGQLIVNVLRYSTDRLYDNQGHRQSQTDYSKYEINPYFEYGLIDGVTVGTNLSLQRAHQDGAPDQTNWGVGDSEFFVRARLWQESGFAVSAEPMVKLGSPDSSDERPLLGGRHPDLGFGLSAGYGFNAAGLDHFVDFTAQYRWRFGDPEDQVRFAATLGAGLTPRWTALGQIFVTRRTETPGMAGFTQSSGDDYDLTKLQLSAIYKFDQRLFLQAGAFNHVDGKNVGAGGGVLFSIWKRF